MGLRDDLAGDGGSSLIGFMPGGTGAAATTVEARLREFVIAADFAGVDPTGTTNSTAGLLAFFNHCIDTGKPGWIPPGIYLITPGLLVFDNGFVETAFPNIYTAGALATTFKTDPATSNHADYNKPLLKISNGTFPGSGSVDQTWYGGFLGGIRFVDETNHTAADRHGIELRGLTGARFEHLRGETLRGSTLHCDNKTVGGTETVNGNPDHYQVAVCQFGIVEGFGNAGKVVHNENGQGLSGCSFFLIRAVGCVSGVFSGWGAGNSIGFVSAGACAGWALDADTTGWSVLSNFYVGVVELDDCQNGIRAQKYSNIRISGRIIHRYDATALNTDDAYWPRTALSFGAGSGGVVTVANISLIHRIDPGGTLSDLGNFLDFNNVGAGNVTIFTEVNDNASLSITDAHMVDNYNAGASAGVLVRNAYKTIIANVQRRAAYAYVTGTSTVGTTLGGAASIIAFGAERYDESGDFDHTTYGFTVPWTGKVRFRAQIHVACSAAGKYLQLYALRKTGASYAAPLTLKRYATTTNLECYQIFGEFDVTSGDVVYLGASTDDTARTITLVVSHHSDNWLQIEMVT